MRTPLTIRPIAFLLLLVFSSAGLSLPAKVSEWKDAQGASFKAEPIEVIGPLAVFRTSSGGGRRVLLRTMSQEDCLRFHEESSRRPARAEKLSEAKGAATRELIGHTLRFRSSDKKLIPADLSSTPEPQLLLMVYGSHNEGEGWTMLDNMLSIDARIQRVMPGVVQTVFMGVRHTDAEHRRMAAEKQLPWLIADLLVEPSMTLLARYAPAEGTNMLLLSREGVPLLSARATDLTETGRFCDQLTELLALINPANPLTWKDRAHYHGTVRLKEFAQSRTDPLLVGNPLRSDGLRQRGIERIAARLEIGADGSVNPSLLLEKSVIPEAMVAPLTDALRKAVVLPAVDHGAPVAGILDYELEAPSEDRSLQADQRWLSGELTAEFPITEWLVLRPIRVLEQSFVDHENASGVVVMKAMEVTKAQVSRSAQNNAFNTDWFSGAGASSVAPKSGDKQMIDEETLTWEPVKSKDGLVDLRAGLKSIDYCVGYAWTEFESPADMNAWLGIGSDDGLKIWLNGELVHDKWIRRISRIDDDVVPMRLKKGSNRLLIKIQNAAGDWSFIYRLRTKGR